MEAETRERRAPYKRRHLRGESESVLSFVGRCGAGACGSPQNETGYVGGDVKRERGGAAAACGGV